MKVKCEQHIGSGDFWTVYRILFEEEVLFHSMPYKQAIFKKSLESETSENINRNLANYSLVKESGLPTLNFFEKVTISGVEGILGEDLNSDERVTFVSPSNASAALTYHELPSFLRPRKQMLLPEAEALLYKEKVGLIANFDQLIEKFFKDMKRTEIKKICFYKDSFFFGFTHQNSDVSYRVANFDNIETCEDESDVCRINCGQILHSFYLFILRFVQETPLRKEYERKVIKLLREVRREA